MLTKVKIFEKLTQINGKNKTQFVKKKKKGKKKIEKVKRANKTTDQKSKNIKQI